MGMIAIGFAVGLALGAGTGTAAGAFTGAALGMLLGLSAAAARWLYDHSSDVRVRERHRLMCTTRGTFADCELEGAADRGRWLAVHRCSLQAESPPACDRRCLRLINDAGVRPAGPSRPA